MKNLKINIILMLVICAFLAGTFTSYAAELPDADTLGSITVTIRDKEKEVAGGNLLLYKVADVDLSDGSFSYLVTEEFQGLLSKIDENKLGSGEYAAEFETYVKNQKLSGRDMPVDGQGLARAKGLEIGLYLIIQNQAAEGYEPIKSFLVTIPMTEDGALIYDVDASPKVEIDKPDKPDNPPNNPPKNPPSRIPQTGQLWWPVPVCAILGCWLFLFGYFRRKNGENQD